jgi:hypothetical protein
MAPKKRAGKSKGKQSKADTEAGSSTAPTASVSASAESSRASDPFRSKILVGCFIEQDNALGDPNPRDMCEAGTSDLSKRDLAGFASLVATLMSGPKPYKRGTQKYANFCKLLKKDPERTLGYFTSNTAKEIDHTLSSLKISLSIGCMTREQLDRGRALENSGTEGDALVITKSLLVDAVRQAAEEKATSKLIKSVDWDKVVDEVLQTDALKTAADSLVTESN